MANPETAASDVVTFTEGDLDGEVNPLPVDPELFKLDHSNSNVDLKEQEEAKEKEKNDGSQTFKSMIIVSGVVVAVIGAIFAITKKLRET